MKSKVNFFLVAVLLAFANSCTSPAPKEEAATITNNAPAVTDPLPSWSDGSTKKAIIDFVSKTAT